MPADMQLSAVVPDAFQAGHAGSIPVARFHGPAAGQRYFFATFLGTSTRHARGVVPFGCSPSNPAPFVLHPPSMSGRRQGFTGRLHYRTSNCLPWQTKVVDGARDVSGLHIVTEAVNSEVSNCSWGCPGCCRSWATERSALAGLTRTGSGMKSNSTSSLAASGSARTMPHPSDTYRG
jgi:hypothetical protein